MEGRGLRPAGRAVIVSLAKGLGLLVQAAGVCVGVSGSLGVCMCLRVPVCVLLRVAVSPCPQQRALCDPMYVCYSLCPGLCVYVYSSVSVIPECGCVF